MAEIYEWLEGLGQPPEPMNEDLFEGVPMGEVIPLARDEDGNGYFDVPHAWGEHFEPQIDDEPIPIDPSLHVMTEPPAPTFGQAVVTVPEELAEASSNLLVYLIRILEIPATASMDEESTERMTFTAEELEILEPIIEEESESIIPDEIDGVRVNTNPKSKEIKEIIDFRRIGPNRRTFYLAKASDGRYYWFRSPCTDRDWQFRKLIGDYRHKSRLERKSHGIKRLRSGRRIRM